MKTKTNPVCRVCGAALNDENCFPSDRGNYNHICKSCKAEISKQWWRANPEKRRAQQRHWRKANPEKVNASQRRWRKTHPDKAKIIWTRRHRKEGQRPYNENKESASFLGVHIAEGALSQAFENMKRMPMNTPGYDFMWQGYKIDVKSSCLIHYVVGGIEYSHWNFGIRHNQIADYFLCIAFDDRETLNPLYLWLIPGDVLNHLATTSISPSTIRKWAQYELTDKLDKVIACCDAMKKHDEVLR